MVRAVLLLLYSRPLILHAIQLNMMCAEAVRPSQWGPLAKARAEMLPCIAQVHQGFAVHCHCDQYLTLFGECTTFVLPTSAHIAK